MQISRAYTERGGGVTVANEPARSFKFRFKIRLMWHARSRFCDHSWPCLIAFEVYSPCNMHASDRRRARKTVYCSSVLGKQVTCTDCRLLTARSGQVISVQNDAHSFCSNATFHFNL